MIDLMIEDAQSISRQRLPSYASDTAVVMRERYISSSASRLREVHEVYNMIHDASMRHLASYGKLHNVCDPINIAIHFYINFDVEV